MPDLTELNECIRTAQAIGFLTNILEKAKEKLETNDDMTDWLREYYQSTCDSCSQAIKILNEKYEELCSKFEGG